MLDRMFIAATSQHIGKTTTTLDTHGSAVRINKIEVKINTKTPWKVNRAIELIGEHVAWRRAF